MWEQATSSPWCQRWNGGTTSWRHLSDGGFDARRYVVEAVGETHAKEFVTTHHYSRTYPAARARYGLFDTGYPDGAERRLVGVAVFGIPVQAAVLSRALPSLEPYAESLELSRFVLLDECPGNTESWFLARCFELLRRSGVRGVVSFADPVPRRAAAGHIVMPGHCGWIYQASNAVYTGRGTARTLIVLPDATVLNARAAQKIRAQEQGHEYLEARLVALGAQTLRPGQVPREWLSEALDAVGARRVRHPGPHRYVFRLGRNQREREQVKLGFSTLPYPKVVDQLPR